MRSSQRDALPFAALSLALVLAACGGGGGGNDDPAPASSSAASSSVAAAVVISGTAATGAPIVGSLTVKDATGATRSQPLALADNGKFSLDVSGLTPPLLLRATSATGGETLDVHSALATVSPGATVNVTPLTDLIVSNALGTVAGTAFDSGSFASLSASDLNAETTRLTARLQPVLGALAVSSGTHLLTTPFTPQSDPIDKVLDILKLSYSGNTATLTNIATTQAITDDVTVKAAAESSAPAMDNTTNLATGAADVSAIIDALKSYAALFVNGQPTTSAVRARLTTNFISWDLVAADFAAEDAANTKNAGMRFDNFEVLGLNYTQDSAVPRANVSFSVIGSNGKEFDRVRNMRMRKVAGTWLLHGNRQCVEMNARKRIFTNTDLNGTRYTTGIDFTLSDNTPANCGTARNVAVGYAIIKGPGLPAEGVRYNSPASAGDHFTNGAGKVFHQLSDSYDRKLIDGIPANAPYTVTLYDTTGHTFADDYNSFVNIGGVASGGDTIRLSPYE
ncbi:MAG: hypothetical protein REI09_07960 [Candidatus Dactylopiibacterium sp.]|nr:hypothetical protein [Candidatus Dactylopiibacterium sp.]